MVAGSKVSLTRDLHLGQPVNVALTLSLLRRGPGDPTTRREHGRLWRTSRMPTGPATYVLRQSPPDAVHAAAQAVFDEVGKAATVSVNAEAVSDIVENRFRERIRPLEDHSHATAKIYNIHRFNVLTIE